MCEVEQLELELELELELIAKVENELLTKVEQLELGEQIELEQQCALAHGKNTWLSPALKLLGIATVLDFCDKSPTRKVAKPSAGTEPEDAAKAVLVAIRAKDATNLLCPDASEGDQVDTLLSLGAYVAQCEPQARQDKASATLREAADPWKLERDAADVMLKSRLLLMGNLTTVLTLLLGIEIPQLRAIEGVSEFAVVATIATSVAVGSTIVGLSCAIIFQMLAVKIKEGCARKFIGATSAVDWLLYIPKLALAVSCPCTIVSLACIVCVRYNNHWSAIVAFAILVGALVAFLPALRAYRQIQVEDSDRGHCGKDMVKKYEVFLERSTDCLIAE